MKIAIVGTGYVGLVTGTCLAECGHDVVCIDKDATKVAMLKAGKIPIYEPGLAELVIRNACCGQLRFTTDVGSGIAEAELVFIAVGTPQGQDGGADLRGIWASGLEIAANLVAPKIIVIKSTVPVGTNAELARRMAEITDVPFHVVSNPEFLKEGSAVEDFNKPDRVVVGARCPAAVDRLRELYRPILRGDRPFLAMTPESAEMTKYVANCLLATKISFINEMANLCTTYHAHIDDVRRGIGYDRRIGFSFLSAGVGYGGSCFPKDIRAVIKLAKDAGVASRIMEAVDLANEAQKQVLGRMILDHFGESCRGKRVAIWGLAFKPETDDVRESPALALIDQLLDAGVSIQVADPEALRNVRAIHGGRLTYCEHRYQALEGADALAIVTDWEEYRTPDFVLMKALMNHPTIFDGRNLLDETRAIRCGFLYRGIGRLTAAPRPAGMAAHEAQFEDAQPGTDSFDPAWITCEPLVLAPAEWVESLQEFA